MIKLKYSAYSLIVIAIIKIALLIHFGQLGKEINLLESRFSDVNIKLGRVSTFEDSLIYSTSFRTRVLGTSFKRAQLDSAIAANRLQAEKAIKDVERINDERIELGRNLKILNGIDSLLEIMFVLVAGLVIYFWIKLRK